VGAVKATLVARARGLGCGGGVGGEGVEGMEVGWRRKLDLLLREGKTRR
jgi:hypothetical protein